MFAKRHTLILRRMTYSVYATYCLFSQIENDNAKIVQSDSTKTCNMLIASVFAFSWYWRSSFLILDRIWWSANYAPV